MAEYITANTQSFLERNKVSPVIYGQADLGGGGTYILADGMVFKLCKTECLSIPPPWWAFPHKGTR